MKTGWLLLGSLLLTGWAQAQEMDFQVSLLGPLSTQSSHKGDQVTAVVVAPDRFKGDIIRGTVTEVRAGGKIRGTSVLNFQFDTLQHNGAAVPVTTQVKAFINSKGKVDVDEEGRAVRKSNNLGKVAGATGAGALIGGLAGGWKGAAIGAGAGAVAGVVLIEVAAEGPRIRFDTGSKVDLSVKGRGGPELASLDPNRGASWGAAAASPEGAPVAASASVAESVAAAPAAAQSAVAPAAASASLPAAAPRETAAPPVGSDQPDFTALKDDFIPGEKVVFYDDFTDMSADEAPPHWKVRGNAVTLMAAGALRQLNVGNRTTLTPGIKKYPKNFTLEQDMKCGGEACEFSWFFFGPEDHGNAALEVHGGTDGDKIRFWAKTRSEGLVDSNVEVDWRAPTQHAIWLQNGRLRLYYGGKKVGDFNQLELPDFDYAYMVVNDFQQGPLGFTRVRLAESTPDFSRVIASSDRFVTHGILFDTDSDRIKPESAAVIKQIAAGLQGNAGLKLKIEGHTDATGNAAHNLELSKRRAEAVKTVLVSEFQVDAGRLTTDGLGATKPIDSNETPQGRAQNRRVEFVKQ